MLIIKSMMMIESIDLRAAYATFDCWFSFQGGDPRVATVPPCPLHMGGLCSQAPDALETPKRKTTLVPQQTLNFGHLSSSQSLCTLVVKAGHDLVFNLNMPFRKTDSGEETNNRAMGLV